MQNLSGTHPAKNRKKSVSFIFFHKKLHVQKQSLTFARFKCVVCVVFFADCHTLIAD